MVVHRTVRTVIVAYYLGEIAGVPVSGSVVVRDSGMLAVLSVTPGLAVLWYDL